MPCIRLGSAWFSRKSDALAEVRRLLHSAVPDAPLTGRDLDLIRALFDLHPHRNEVADRNGILGFAVKENNFHGAFTRGFHVLHGRNTTPFSYLTCFNPERAKPDPLQAMRAAIMLSQREVMWAHFGPNASARCSYCPATIGRAAAHVHHEEPKFRTIVERYVEAHGWPVCRSSAYLGDIFCDPAEQQRWLAFHDSIAKRVVVCAACNYNDERR